MESILKKEEAVALKLRGLYERYGYRKVKMSRFEEYDLYLDNKSFLNVKHIITFSDLDGRVLALKPDVTLSLAKNTRATARTSEKLYYLENVYRLDRESRSYREIAQLGLEYFGRLDGFAMGEVMRLAAATLKEISENWLLSISHTGFVLRLLESLSIEPAAREALIESIRLKRAHEIKNNPEKFSVTPAVADMLAAIASLGGAFQPTLLKARALSIVKGMTDALDELEQVYQQLEAAGLGDKARLDFSLIIDADYYSGVVLEGYVEGVPRPVLAGGYYGALMRKFGKDLDAIGFAVYLDELVSLYRAPRAADVDALVLYDESADLRILLRETERLISSGLRVRAEKNIPSELKYGRLFRFEHGLMREESPC